MIIVGVAHGGAEWVSDALDCPGQVVIIRERVVAARGGTFQLIEVPRLSGQARELIVLVDHAAEACLSHLGAIACRIIFEAHGSRQRDGRTRRNDGVRLQ